MGVEDDFRDLAISLGYNEVQPVALPAFKRAGALKRIADLLGVDKDVIDTALEAGRETADLSVAGANIDKDEIPWPVFKALPKRPRIPPMSPELIPAPLRPWVCDIARQACLPLEMVAVPAMVGLSSLIGRNLRVQPDIQSAWTTPPNIWGAIVARPGSMKSHAMGAALAPVSRLARKAREDHEGEASRIKAKKMALESRLNAIRRRKDPDENEIETLLWKIDTCKSTERRYRTSDPTIEKLGELLIENPKGLLLTRDELSGWLRSLEKHGREGDREFYLEAWGGDGSYTVDRIGRGTLHIPALCLSVIGSIQPGKLKAYAAAAMSGGYGDDGLLQRIQLLVWPDEQPVWKRSCEEPNRDAKSEAFKIYEQVDQACHERQDDPVRFDDHAQAMYDEWRDQLEIRLRDESIAQSPAYEAHISKYRGLVPSIACIIWISEGHYLPEQIGPYDVQRAIRWSEFLDLHARRVYGISPVSMTVSAMASKIESGCVEDGSTVREVSRAKWSCLTEPEDVTEALRGLSEHGWVRVQVVKRGSRRSRIVRIHPALRTSR